MASAPPASPRWSTVPRVPQGSSGTGAPTRSAPVWNAFLRYVVDGRWCTMIRRIQPSSEPSSTEALDSLSNTRMNPSCTRSSRFQLVPGIAQAHGVHTPRDTVAYRSSCATAVRSAGSPPPARVPINSLNRKAFPALQTGGGTETLPGCGNGSCQDKGSRVERGVQEGVERSMAVSSKRQQTAVIAYKRLLPECRFPPRGLLHRSSATAPWTKNLKYTQNTQYP
jgi:hypothetical protein